MIIFGVWRFFVRIALSRTEFRKFNAHVVVERLHVYFSTTSWGFVGSEVSSALFNPLTRRVVFSHISHKQELCGMFFLKEYSLLAFKIPYSWLKVNSFSNFTKKVSEILILPDPLAMSSMSLMFHNKYLHFLSEDFFTVYFTNVYIIIASGICIG